MKKQTNNQLQSLDLLTWRVNFLLLWNLHHRKSENQSWIEFWNSIFSLKTVWNFKNCFLLAFAIKKPLKQWNLGLIWCRNYYNFFIIFNFCPSLIHYHYLLSLHQSFCTKLQKILTSKNMNLYCVFGSFNHYEMRTTIKFSKNLSNSHQIFLNLQ